jgi:hypothetical protein
LLIYHKGIVFPLPLLAGKMAKRLVALVLLVAAVSATQEVRTRARSPSRLSAAELWGHAVTHSYVAYMVSDALRMYS